MNKIKNFLKSVKTKNKARHLWLTPVIIATWEDEIRRIRV
jgi:hypothetical protein